MFRQDKKNKEFTHHIYTNFGVGIFDLRWLIYRLEIFKNTVAISMAQQTCKDFTWYIFVHEQAPFIFKSGLIDFMNTLGINFEVVEVKDYRLISREIDSLKYSVESKVLISSRVDDDDLFYQDAVLEIQNIAKQNHVLVNNNVSTVVSLENGVEYVPEHQIAKPCSYDTIALMLTLITEKRDNRFESVNQFAHHCIVETLSKQNKQIIHKKINNKKPLYAYVKHALSDSFYAGAKARVLKCPTSYNVSAKKFSHFGVNKHHLELLGKLTEEIPTGMPFKYLDKLNQSKLILASKNSTDIEKQEASFRLKFMSLRATRERALRTGSDRKIKLAILGSCVTRDLFEFHPELKEVFEITYYNARSNFSSYMSVPFEGFHLPKDQGFQVKVASRDLEKSYWHELELSQPDLIICDFIDERIGVIESAGSLLAASGPTIAKFEATYNTEPEILRPWSGRVVKLREWAVPQFFSKLNSICNNIIIHKASWANEFIENDNVKPFKGTEWETLIGLNNNILETIFNYVENSHLGMDIVGGNDIGMLAGGDFKWSFSPFHYDKSYYKSLSRQIMTRIE